MTIPNQSLSHSVSSARLAENAHLQSASRVSGRGRNDDEFFPITIDEMIARCELTMRRLDEQLRGKLSEQETRNGKLKALSGVSQSITGLGKRPDQGTNPLGHAEWATARDKIFEDAKKENPELAEVLDNARAPMNGSAEGAKAANDAVNQEMDSIRSENETSMITIQSIISKRSQALQMTSNIVNSFNEASKGLIQNIR